MPRKMEYAAQVEKRIRHRCVVLEMSEIKGALPSLSKFLAKIPRIPSIIHTDKDYGTFSVEGGFPASSIIVLVTRDVPNVLNYSEVEIVLKISYFSHTEILKVLIGEELAVHSYEMIGNIIHLNLNDNQLPYKEIIGKVLNFKTGCTVINKRGRIDNTFRFYDLEVLCGQDDLRTVHSENGVSLFIDLRRVYWCSRLQEDRSEILLKMRRGETLCDPFCGAGPLVLPALKKGLIVYGNDLNPAAVECVEKSLILNKLQCHKLCCMDAGDFIQSITGAKIDHFVFNLPEYSLDYIKYLKGFSGFRLHCFFFCRDSTDPVEQVFERTGLVVNRSSIYYIRKVSPSKSVYKLDVSAERLFSKKKP